MTQSIYDFMVIDIDGKEVQLNQYKDKVLLIVNTASKCGFTNQYAGLEELYKKYQPQGLVVLGFPCNQFLSQEPGDEVEIKNFCTLTYNVTFPMFAKIDVNGENTHPLYKFLKEQAPGLLGSEVIKWNFTKFLINKSGQVVNRYAPATEPVCLVSDIEQLLK